MSRVSPPSCGPIPKACTRARVSKKAIKDPAHLDYIRRNACIVCVPGGQPMPRQKWVLGFPRLSDPHHCRKLLPGGLLPRHDALTVPLCRGHHDMMNGDERALWKKLGIDPAAWISSFSPEGRAAIEALKVRK